MPVPHRHEYIHHQDPGLGSTIRELVFGMEDGMVSTLGSITGIAAATQHPFTIILSGFVIVSVESISMAVGSYLSSKSERDIDERKLQEERTELKEYPEEEKQELVDMYAKDGWPRDLSVQMAEVASKNKQLFLQEMAYRELKIFPENLAHPRLNALVMGLSYIGGGAVPLLPYLFLPLGSAIVLSIVITFIGLFFVGVFTTKFSHRSWWKAGLEMLTLAGIAAAVGYGVGQVVENFWLSR
ncbi:MAG: VIT1/CCC1 transporter family protein [Patescibacteria group bacterium]